MSKEIRFSKLVQKAGKPQTMTLWTKPKDNPAFMKAVNENRVVTVFQNPVGTKKDFGIIGFQQEKFAAYLIFPKPLPKLEDVVVIGIKYDLLQEQVEEATEKKNELPKREHKPFVLNGSHRPHNGVQKLKPDVEQFKKFQVKVVRKGIIEAIITVRGKNIAQAEANALAKVKTQKFQPNNVRDEVKSITEI